MNEAGSLVIIATLGEGGNTSSFGTERSRLATCVNEWGTFVLDARTLGHVPAGSLGGSRTASDLDSVQPIVVDAARTRCSRERLERGRSPRSSYRKSSLLLCRCCYSTAQAHPAYSIRPFEGELGA